MFFSFLDALLSFRLFFLLHFTGQNAYPKPLTAQEEAECFERMQSGNAAMAKEARDRLILHNLRLVAHVVKKYDTHEESKEDLLSIGTIGLLKAADSYSWDKSVRFSTYAARCVENEILMKFRTNRKFDRDVSMQEIAEEHTEDGKASVIERIADDQNIQEDAERKILSEQLYHKMASCLTKREQYVIEQRYGLNPDGKEAPQWEIAAQLGVSRSYVSRIEKSAIAKLKRAFR